MAACSAEPEDTGEPVTLPEDTGTGPVSDTGLLLPDTGLGEEDIAPTHWLTIRQAGTWELSPPAGPYTALTGTMTVIEIIDEEGFDPEEDEPACEATFALTGEELDYNGCDDCDVAFAVDFYLTDGSTSECRDPDLPSHEATRSLGWASSERLIYYNYHYTGVWIPWFQAEETDDDLVEFTYEAVIAIALDEEEEEEE